MRHILFLAPLGALIGCTKPDPREEVREQWATDSTRYAGLDCEMVPLDEGGECRRVNGALRRRQREAEEDAARLNRLRSLARERSPADTTPDMVPLFPAD